MPEDLLTPALLQMLRDLTPRTYYKLLRRRDGKLQSFTAPSLDPRLIVTYLPGQWVEAPVGGIFVYDRLSPALIEMQFYPDRGLFHVYSCECEDELPFPPNFEIPSLISYQHALEFWQGESTGFASKPARVRTFRRVRLVKEVCRSMDRRLSPPAGRLRTIW